MLHLRLEDGSDIYVNSLAIRCVLPHRNDDQCRIYYDATNFHIVLGTAKQIADTVHKALHMIHLQD